MLNRYTTKLFLSLSLLCIIILVFSTYCLSAETVTVHGHSGHIEYKDRVDGDRQFLGWGLDFNQSPGLGNWIHYSLPVPLFSEVRYIALRFQTGSIDVSITTVDIFDGSTRIFRDDGLNLSGDKQWYLVDMGEAKLIDEALGVSIEVGAGVEMMSHRVQIHSVATLWEESSP